jgi:hypothetical protein
VADTGAPWLLPYPISSDLVRDGADAIKDLAEATATGLSAAGNAGIGSNVVQAVKTDTFTTTSATFTDVTGLSATITPTSNTSKVLIIVQLSMSTGATNPSVRIAGGNSATYIGDADGSRVRSVFTMSQQSPMGLQNLSFGIVYLDSPASGSAQTYSVEIRRGSDVGNVYVNRSSNDVDNESHGRGASSITVIEVAP